MLNWRFIDLTLMSVINVKITPVFGKKIESLVGNLETINQMRRRRSNPRKNSVTKSRSKKILFRSMCVTLLRDEYFYNLMHILK